MFRHNGTVIMSNNKESHEIGHAIGNLYYFTPALTSELYFAASDINNDPYVLWHHRFGHPGQHILESISEHVVGISGALKNSNLKICQGCIYAKSHRQPFPKTSTNRATQLLERVHSDLCGPMPVPSLNGSRYILTFIDDASRYTRVYFLEHKGDTFVTFREYRVLVEKEVGQPIKILRSDGGGEYINHDMKNYLAQNGIRHETSTPDTPQQNGVAERYNRTLLETVSILRGYPKSSGRKLQLQQHTYAIDYRVRPATIRHHTSYGEERNPTFSISE
jgi:transposase InsO family protein